MTAKILSFALSIIFACGFLAGCGSESKEPSYRSATLENLLTQDKYKGGGNFQILVFAVPRLVEDKWLLRKSIDRPYDLYASLEKGSDGVHITVWSAEELPTFKYMYVKGRFSLNDKRYDFYVHGWFFPL